QHTQQQRAAPQAPTAHAPAPVPQQPAPPPPPAYTKPKVYNDVDPRTGLQKLPTDKLDSAKKQVEHINSSDVVAEEETRLRSTPSPLVPPEKPPASTWFLTNVVDHRHAWCCLRDAGERAGMRRVLKERPWGNPREPLEGGKEAAGSDVLKLMSFAAQYYLKNMLDELAVVAYQRKGGLSAELLSGVESRLRDPNVKDPKAELRQSLVPRLPRVGDLPRVILERTEEAHRKECEEREERWDVELADTLATAEEVRKRLIRRGTKKLPPGSFKWWEDMETRAKSGWLSKEQLAGSEFARRVAVKHGIGVVAALMKKKELASKESAAASAAEPAGAAAAAAAAAVADGGNADDPMDVSDRPTTGDSSSGGRSSKDSNGKAGNERAPGAGLKRPLDPLASDDPAETVRNIRRRLVLGAPDDGDDDDDDGSGEGATPPSEEQEASLEINNADLAELLRSTKPRGDPRKWARVLLRAQNSRKGVHA
ncbi:unnamed protein product, partial [Ectocarpus sp. 12 AP-2014]